ncbi:MAG: antibiotic biosynthesis monooxygenase [Gaiellaceae bacterium]
MIARVWRGSTSLDNAPGYEEHLESTTLPALRELEGHCGAYVLRRDGSQEADFVVLTFWSSTGAVRAFAGDDVERAVIPDEARRLLLRWEEKASHFEVRHADGA